MVSSVTRTTPRRDRHTETLLLPHSVRCRARGHWGAACYLLFPQVERLLRSLLAPEGRIAVPRNKALAVTSDAIMRTTMGAAIDRLRSMYNQPCSSSPWQPPSPRCATSVHTAS